jgi:hypothetical protein
MDLFNCDWRNPVKIFPFKKAVSKQRLFYLRNAARDVISET